MYIKVISEQASNNISQAKMLHGVVYQFLRLRGSLNCFDRVTIIQATLKRYIRVY